MSFFSGRRQSDSEQSSAAIGFDTVLSASTMLEGTLKSEGNIRLDGHFTGKLDITGNVLVGESAEINADIEARNISIAGIVRGNIVGNKVQLLKTGHIKGDIKATSLTTEEGAFIEGNVTMTMPPAPEPITVNDEDEETDTIASRAADSEDATIPGVAEALDQTSPDLDDENDNPDLTD